MKGRIAKLRRVQELFTNGAVAVVGEGDNAEPLWIAKPTALERDEIGKDARGARARRVIAFDRDEDEQAIIADQLNELTDAQIIEALLAGKASEHYARALNEVRTNKDWQERLEALDRADTIDDDAHPDAKQEEALGATFKDFEAEVDRLAKKLGNDFDEEQAQKSRVELDKDYRGAWRELAGFEAYMTARRMTELWFAIRLCDATRTDDGWDHAACNHDERLCESRADVARLPDEVLIACRAVYEDLLISAQDAGNSAAPGSSSASSGQPNVEAASPASTPAVT